MSIPRHRNAASVASASTADIRKRSPTSTTRDRIPVTSPVRTLVDLAARAERARDRGPREPSRQARPDRPGRPARSARRTRRRAWRAALRRRPRPCDLRAHRLRARATLPARSRVAPACRSRDTPVGQRLPGRLLLARARAGGRDRRPALPPHSDRSRPATRCATTPIGPRASRRCASPTPRCDTSPGTWTRSGRGDPQGAARIELPRGWPPRAPARNRSRPRTSTRSQARSRRDGGLLGARLDRPAVRDGRPARPRGPGAWFGNLFAAMPDFSMSVADMVAYGDKAAVRWTATGTFTGPAEFEGLHRPGSRVIGGPRPPDDPRRQGAENFAYTNTTEIARQLGAMPPAGSMGERTMLGAVNTRTAAIAWVPRRARRRYRSRAAALLRPAASPPSRRRRGSPASTTAGSSSRASARSAGGSRPRRAPARRCRTRSQSPPAGASGRAGPRRRSGTGRPPGPASPRCGSGPG